MKSCSVCGKPYYRRNLLEVWDVRNPGHRVGWGKTELRVCLGCSSAQRSQTAVVALVGVKAAEEMADVDEKKESLPSARTRLARAPALTRVAERRVRL